MSLSHNLCADSPMPAQVNKRLPGWEDPPTRAKIQVGAAHIHDLDPWSYMQAKACGSIMSACAAAWLFIRQEQWPPSWVGGRIYTFAHVDVRARGSRTAVQLYMLFCVPGCWSVQRALRCSIDGLHLLLPGCSIMRYVFQEQACGCCPRPSNRECLLRIAHHKFTLCYVA